MTTTQARSSQRAHQAAPQAPHLHHLASPSSHRGTVPPPCCHRGVCRGTRQSTATCNPQIRYSLRRTSLFFASSFSCLAPFPTLCKPTYSCFVSATVRVCASVRVVCVCVCVCVCGVQQPHIQARFDYYKNNEPLEPAVPPSLYYSGAGRRSPSYADTNTHNIHSHKRLCAHERVCSLIRECHEVSAENSNVDREPKDGENDDHDAFWEHWRAFEERSDRFHRGGGRRGLERRSKKSSVIDATRRSSPSPLRVSSGMCCVYVCVCVVRVCVCVCVCVEDLLPNAHTKNKICCPHTRGGGGGISEYHPIYTGTGNTKSS
jgi:hypothetical protein